MKKKITGRRLLAFAGWSIAACFAATISWWAYFAPDDHIRGLIIGLGGALSLSIPPVRQAYRNYPFRNMTDHVEGEELREIVEAIVKRQTKAFIEFSWLDVLFFSIGPILLAVGIYLDVQHALEHQHAPAPAAAASAPSH